MGRLEQENFECVAVMSLTDFTTDTDDLVKFCFQLGSLGCKLYSIEESRFIPNKLKDGKMYKEEEEI